MLDKETLTRQAITETKMDQEPKVNREPRTDQEMGLFLECLGKARVRIEHESVKECFYRAQGSIKDL